MRNSVKIKILQLKQANTKTYNSREEPESLEVLQYITSSGRY